MTGPSKRTSGHAVPAGHRIALPSAAWAFYSANGERMMMTDTPETKPDTIDIAEIGNSRASWAKAGVAVGIGSAAIAAALLYANRPSKKRK